MSRHDFGHIPVKECGEQLMLVDPSEFLCEPKYFEWGFADSQDMYLREGTLERLRQAATDLPRGFRFKLWDCFRPLNVQQALFKKCTDDISRAHADWDEQRVFEEARKFIAIPDKGGEVPPHNTGGTIDLTLVNGNGEELNMGTEFDEFGDACYPFFFHEIVGPDQEEQSIVRNRDLLFTVMTSAGFRQDTDEWWHFDYGNQLWALEKNEPYAFYGSAENDIP